MVELIIKEEKKNAISFHKYNTYIFVQKYSNKYNGYITEVHDEEFMFQDDKIPTPFPIRFDSLVAPLVPSTKEAKQ